MAKYKIAFLCDGHGSQTPGKRTPYVQELGRSIKENEFNSAVVDLIAAKLKPLGIIPILVAPTDADTPLKQRTDFANNTFRSYKERFGGSNVDAVYVSVHYDAVSNSWANAEGITIYVYNGMKYKQSGLLAKAIGEFLPQGTKQQYRGIKEANFHVLRETVMPAVLTENGFMSSHWESMLMINKSFQEEVATEHVKGICKYLNVTYKEATPPSTPNQSVSQPTSGTHTIVKGDTLTKIADKYGVTVDAIKKENPGVEPTKLQIGQIIKLPSNIKPTTHTILKGDTYTKIADKYGVSIDSLKKLNPGVDPTKLQIGHVIKIR
ncbi:N-acetylmuramoyl-L-alanine amidase [Priestia megaterium]|uniref:N-acetylmuramoyl-L-alanine amidase n=1 Tax=Priestia megaterium TaxID=1404 RepID=UPI002E1AB5EE|nr:N-acetylmuramoyl-L-alanine amidase [Priestia megaterium]MED4068654.1 N-acetylmuramoyl-L-alanine amidase [Priestia megaterium]